MSSPLIHPQFDPIALRLGPVSIHWYGLTYLAAFMFFLWLGIRRARQPVFAERGWLRRDVEDMLFFGVLGVVIGGRLGYVIFYKGAYYAQHLAEVFQLWKGGMSFHGGMLGVLVAMGVYAHTRKRRFFEVTDLIAPCVPTGLACGRIGNFINGELWGREAPADLPWAMIFPQAGQPLVPRHPSQVYQLLMEGLLLFALLWWYARRPQAYCGTHGGPTWGKVSGAFLIGYGVFRFVAEYFRQPDDFLGLLTLGLSMGQWLSLPMLGAGVIIWTWAHRRMERQGATP